MFWLAGPGDGSPPGPALVSGSGDAGCFPARCYGGGWFGAVDAGTAAAVQNCLPQDLALLSLQLRVQVAVELVDDGGELVDEFPHRQRSFPPLQDEEHRSEM